MLTSSIFLFITLIVYTYIPKLLTHCTRLMRHFAFALMLAFMFMAIPQLNMRIDGTLLCALFGKYFVISLWVNHKNTQCAGEQYDPQHL